MHDLTGTGVGSRRQPADVGELEVPLVEATTKGCSKGEFIVAHGSQVSKVKDQAVAEGNERYGTSCMDGILDATTRAILRVCSS
jgi:hypothetical protein